MFDQLIETVAWRVEKRQMYDRVVDVPRPELGEPFRTAGLCLYRRQRQRRWHGDTIGRGSTQDTMVAIVSLGAPRIW